MDKIKEKTNRKSSQSSPTLSPGENHGEAHGEDDPSSTSFLAIARNFYRTGKGGGFDSKDLFPALMAPYRDGQDIRYDYPFWIEVTDGAFSFCSLSVLLQNVTALFAPEEGSAQVFKANLPLLEKMIRETFTSDGPPLLEGRIILEALEEMKENLSLKGDAGEELSASASQFSENLPVRGFLFAFCAKTPLYLLSLICREKQGLAKAEMVAKIAKLKTKLQELMTLENLKNPQTGKAKKTAKTSLIDFSALAKLRPQSSSQTMAPERKARIEKAMALLESAEKKLESSTLVLPKNWMKKIWGESVKWKEIFPGWKIESADVGKVCQKAEEVFENQVNTAKELFWAFRVANLEVEDCYQEDVHNPFFENFDWKSFRPEEWSACPATVVLEEEGHLLSRDLTSLSRLLISAKPIRIVAVRTFSAEPSQNQDRSPFRHELAPLAISHRHSFVGQCSTGNPTHLVENLLQGIHAPFPALFQILLAESSQQSHLQAYLTLGAALESRDFPLFTYDPRKGKDQWGSRFQIQNNPQNQRDWPLYEMTLSEDEQVSVPFTFADYAGLDPRHNQEFLPLKEGKEESLTEYLVPLWDYIHLSDPLGKLPYVYMARQNGEREKVLISHSLVLLCQERLDFWHFIQDLGGARSYYAIQAADRARKEVLEEMEREKSALLLEYQQEVDRIKRESAGEAMEKLAAVLLNMDHFAVPSSSVSLAPSVVVSATAETDGEPVSETTAPPAEPEEEEDLSFGEPYIDSFLCTTCNECTDLNPNLFRYNGDKQAEIADPRGGPYLHLVKAAEACPAKCIHPGQPLDPNEDNLEALKKRAEPFL